MTRASKGQYSQDDERPRRMQLWYLVSLLAASGLRSSALCSSAESSLRWGDIEETDVQVEVTRMSNDTRGSKRALLLKIRDATKTGRRTVSALVGHYIDLHASLFLHDRTAQERSVGHSGLKSAWHKH